MDTMSDFNSPDLFDVDPAIHKKADELMQEAVLTYRERNAVYGSSYHKHGQVMAALYTKGLTLVTPHDFNLMGCLNMIISKICRLSQTPDHRDSIHDIGVYAFMYEELLAKRELELENVARMADVLIPFTCGDAGVPDVLTIEELKRHMDAGTVKAGDARPYSDMSFDEKVAARERLDR
jgi:hypothetical protein